MGFGFPTGMRLIAAVDTRPTPWFWGVNGAMGVLGSIVAVIISMAWGIGVTMTVGALCYLLLIPEIQELRGVSSTSVLRTLLENRLTRIAGRKEVVGRPFIYRTTREFLVRFGLNHIKDLPELEELEEALGLGVTESPPVDHEEQILQQVALLDEAEDEGDDSSAS